jgi:hypothetical protein
MAGHGTSGGDRADADDRHTLHGDGPLRQTASLGRESGLKMWRPADDAHVNMPPRDDIPQMDDALRAEQFDALVQELLPMVRQLWPELDPVAALRATAELAEARMKEGGKLTWGPPRL